ncbi:unnamed protein product [Discula destructiva]
MEKPQISTLAPELRNEIWTLALLPDPGVYHFNPADFGVTDDLDFSSQPWLIPKRSYPTAMHLCRESRGLALKLMERDPDLRLGHASRPFDPIIDTFWFDKKGPHHPWVINKRSVIGSRVHEIRNLAVSAGYIWSVEPDKQLVSNWDSFRWSRLPRFGSLQRVDLVFGKAWIRERSVQSTEEDMEVVGAETEEEDRAPRFDAFDVPELRIEELMGKNASAVKTQEKMAKAQSDVRQVFQSAVKRRIKQGETKETHELGSQRSPDGQDGSQIVFRAVRLMRVTTFRGRRIRYFKVNF